MSKADYIVIVIMFMNLAILIWILRKEMVWYEYMKKKIDKLGGRHEH